MLRERQKHQRMTRAIDAAEALIRETGSTDFTMAELARRAELSPATPFNLFGSKSALLYDLLNRCMDQFLDASRKAASTKDPYDRAIKVGTVLADYFAQDPEFYRPLFQHLVGVTDQDRRPAYMDRGLELWHLAVSGLDEQGALTDDINRDQLARVFVAHFLGALDLWVQGELNNKEFPAQVSYGMALILMSIADDAGLERLLKHVRSARRKLPTKFTLEPDAPHLSLVT